MAPEYGSHHEPLKPTRHDARVQMAVKALQVVGRQIAEPETYTPEEATQLGFLYTSYLHERAFYFSEAETATPTGNELYGRVLDNSRMEREAALFGSVVGDYRPLKRFLSHKAQRDLIIASPGSTNASEPFFIPTQENMGSWRQIKQNSRQLAQAMAKMADVIPDHGQPLQGPIPSWVDEKIINAPDLKYFDVL